MDGGPFPGTWTSSPDHSVPLDEREIKIHMHTKHTCTKYIHTCMHICVLLKKKIFCYCLLDVFSFFCLVDQDLPIFF